MDIEPGTVVANRYRISRPIGRGGMGEVFAAENIRTGRPVAVKLLRADSKAKSSAVKRFQQEARAAGSINSDHVTQVLDVEDDPEHGIVIVFELLEGESLIDRLKRTGPLSFEELHPIIEEVWVGLCDAHKAGVIHRDLKPSNVFLERRPDGVQRVKILDFGISKLPKEMGGETLTEMGQSLGTFSFMPPEQIGRAKTVDHRADIYATTTMIYQSLTGQLPYVARNILVMVEMKSKTNPRPISEAMGHPVDQALEQFVAKGLARNPGDRFQNAIDALEQWRKLKSLSIPASRRMMSSADLNAQARYVPTPASPMQAVPRMPSSSYPASAATGLGASPASQGAPQTVGPRRTPSSYSLPTTAPTGIAAPAPVVPAGMLEPVIPGSLPRLYDQTESTTDISHIEVIPSAAAEAPAVSKAGGIAQRGQEVRSDAPPERKGPQGTRVMPPSVQQAALSFAAQKNASRAGTPLDLQAQSQAAQAAGPASPQPQSAGRTPSQVDLRAHAPQSNGPLSPQPQSLSPQSAAPVGTGQHKSFVPPSGGSMSPDPRAQTPVSGIQPARSFQSDPRLSGVAGAIGAMPPSAQPVRSAPASAAPPPVHLTTVRLPDEPSSIPQSQDKTTVYRPKNRADKPVAKKKQSVAIFVLGAIAFAVVGFGIVYVVQLLWKSFGH